MNQTIAHYKKWKIWARLLFVGLIVLSLPVVSILIFGSPDNSRDYHFAEKSMIIFAWFLAISLMWQMISVFRQLVFHNRRLMWIENDEIIWKRPSCFSVRCTDVVTIIIGIGERSQFDKITFRLRDGSEKVIETNSLDESSDEVVGRLKQILRLNLIQLNGIRRQDS
jgi:hypothetical protein